MDKDAVLKMKPSAYRSMLMGKLGLTKKTKKQTQNLLNWKRENWENLTPKILSDTKFYKCGEKSKEQVKKQLPSVCRPSKQINEQTPKPLSGKLTMKQIKKAVDIKKAGGRINWSKL